MYVGPSACPAWARSGRGDPVRPPLALERVRRRVVVWDLSLPSWTTASPLASSRAIPSFCNASVHNLTRPRSANVESVFFISDPQRVSRVRHYREELKLAPCSSENLSRLSRDPIQGPPPPLRTGRFRRRGLSAELR